MEDGGLSNVLTDATLQALFMRSRRRDIAREAADWKFHYGVDANVIRYWGNPRGSGGRRRHRIGRIFRNDGSALTTAISWGLLTFIFENLGNGRPPLMIVPPIHNEVARILNALHNSESATPSAETRRSIETAVARIRSSLPPDELAQLNVDLQDLLLEEVGERAELRRILLLFSRGRVSRLEDSARDLPQFVREVVFPDDVIRAWARYASHRNGDGEDGWLDRLRRTGEWGSEELLYNDATVLAQLQEWNQRLASGRQGDSRFLYITADHRLFRAADEVVVEDGGQRMSFADAYLRHPHAYLSESGVLGPLDDAAASKDGEEQESVGDWLTLLTQPAEATFAELLDTRRARLDTPEVIRRFADEMGGGPGERGEAAAGRASALLNRWDRFAKGALGVQPPSQDTLLGLGADLERPALEVRNALFDAAEGLEESFRSTLRQYLTVTTRLGREFEANQGGGRALRVVPPIFFEGWRDAGEAVAQMSVWTDEVDDASYQETAARMRSNDSTLYAFYLGNAAFFAARGRWDAAALVTRRARSVASAEQEAARAQNRSTHVNGREAAFFDAVCRRNLALDREALEGARESLATAGEILSREKRTGEFSEYVEERFATEGAMLDLADHLSASDVGGTSSPPDERLRAIADRLWALMDDVGGRPATSGHATGRLAQEDRAGSGTAMQARRRTGIVLAFAILAVSFLPGVRREDEGRALSALGAIEGAIARGDINEKSIGLLDLATLFAARARSRTDGRTRTWRQEARNLGELFARRGEQLAPHDEVMLTALLEGARRA